MRNNSFKFGMEGKTNIVNLLFFLFIILIIYGSIKLIPAFMNGYKLIDAADELARYPGQLTVDQIKDQIMNKAQGLSIPLDRRNLDVKLLENETQISLEFDIPIEFPGYTYVKHFSKTITYPRF